MGTSYDLSRTSRRKFLGAAVLLAGVSGLAACASAAPPAPTVKPADTPAAAPAMATTASAGAAPTATTAAAAAPTATAASAASTAATATPVAPAAAAASSTEPKPSSLSIMWGIDKPTLDVVLPDLQKKLGLTIQADIFPYEGLQQKSFAELAAASTHYDLLFIDTPWMPALANKVQPLSEYISNPKLQEASKLDLQDFIPKVFYDTAVYNAAKPHLHFPDPTKPLDVDNITRQGFNIFGLPIQSNALVMAYRKDLFDDPNEQSAFQSKYGKPLKVPETWDEFVDVGKFFTRPDKRLYGTTLMAGSGDWATDDFKTMLACWGGDGHLVSDEFKTAFNSPEGIAALTFYTELITKHKITPPGVTSFSWNEVGSTFGGGLTAMAMNYGNFSLNKDVKGEIAYALVPKKVTNGPHFGTWLMGVNSFSGHKAWAFQALLGLTGADAQNAMLQTQLHVTRLSSYKKAAADDTLKSKFANYYEVLGKSLEFGVGRPRLTNYGTIDEAIFTAVNEAASGRTAPTNALANAATRVQGLLQQAGYLPT